ncbi:hypothetical protein AVEN_163535-1, partial [Araneus ventricosus]
MSKTAAWLTSPCPILQATSADGRMINDRLFSCTRPTCITDPSWELFETCNQKWMQLLVPDRRSIQPCCPCYEGGVFSDGINVTKI